LVSKETDVTMHSELPPTLHPPKPRLTLRVGVVGHRPDKLELAARTRIEQQLRNIFAAIDVEANYLLATSKDCYLKDRPAVRLISGFAQGSDQLAVSVCPPDWEIEAILPFPKDRYIRTFSAKHFDEEVQNPFDEILKRANVITELSPENTDDHAPPHKGARPPEKGYAEAGSYLLRQIDLLIAIWDGKPPKIAGTGAVARHAFEGGIPVVWIATEDDYVPRLIKGFDPNGDPSAPDTDCTDGPLRNALAPVFAIPAGESRTARRSQTSVLADFYQEVWQEAVYFPFYDILKRFTNGERLRYVIRLDPLEKRLADWDGFMKDAPQVEDLEKRIREILLPRHLWADSLAIYFSHYYRSAYVLTYSLSACAVFIALAGQFANSIDTKAIVVFFELIVIGAIIETIRRGQRWR